MRLHFDRSWFQRAQKTQRQVAQEIGIDEAYLSKVVRGQIEPSVGKAMLIARALQCSVEELYQTDGATTKRTRKRTA
ncbi:MAG: helix-turn-helix transcriptional regulator [Chrysiogenetes bacterium]|nr:helix-turn-helix transcriptional regulator [Chrysiogenetes bacterium]